MTLRIDVDCSPEAKAWLATFSGTRADLDGMPADQPLPLPLTTDASFDEVAQHIHRLFPRAVVAMVSAGRIANPAPEGWSHAGGPTP